MLPPPPPANGPARLLVVDDTRESRTTLARVLTRMGHEVELAVDGVEGFERLARGDIDLAMLDVEMPRCDGITLLRKLRHDPAFAELPVIMVSGVDDAEAVAGCIDLGADDFISKPFEARFVAARVRASLASKRLREWERAYRAMLIEEEARAGRLIADMLPDAIARRLKGGETNIAEQLLDVSVAFADIVGFTARAAAMDAAAVVAQLNAVFSEFDALAVSHGVEKIKTIGDAYMVVGGAPEPRDDHLEAVADFALAASAAASARHGVDLRIGIHVGPVVAGVIGTKRLTYDVWGHTVNLASRLESNGVPRRVQVSREVRDRLERRYRFEARGAVDLKGVGVQETFLLVGRGGVAASAGGTATPVE
jgi:class 3 adenylate cyclase